MTKLDEIAVNVELVLISLIEGAALVALAEQIVRTLEEPDWIRYVPYMLAGLAILLVFWAQSILHAVSFIRWPIRAGHTLTYFVCGLLQIIAYTHILHADGWFLWWTFFSFAAIGMYFLDLQIMRSEYDHFKKLNGGLEFIEAVEARHFYEMKYIVPGAFAFHVAGLIAALLFPHNYVNIVVYMIPGILQFIFTGYVLYDCIKNFRVRSEMIAKLFADNEDFTKRKKNRTTDKDMNSKETAATV
jgi:hypothetical protein